MIKIKNICKSFTDKLVLNNLNLEIEEGTIFGLVGINGAGKSTLLRLISGIYKADNGQILIDEEDIYENDKIKSKLFFLPDEPFYGNNTKPINLSDIYQVFYNFDKNEYLDYLNLFKIPINKPMHNFSKGMKRQVFIALALAIKPKYLLLDEAFDGLDPLTRLSFKKLIIQLVENNKSTVIISSHSLRELEDICDNYGLLDNMEITSSGNLDNKIDSCHKYQIVFNEKVTKDIFNFDIINYQSEGRVIKMVVNYSYDEFLDLIKPYNPLIVDEIPIDFEELFLFEVERRGYVK